MHEELHVKLRKIEIKRPKALGLREIKAHQVSVYFTYSGDRTSVET